MTWYLFASGAALLAGLASIFEKRTLFKEHAMEFSAVFSLLNFLLLIPLIPFIDLNITPINLALLYIASWLGAIGFLYVAKALRHSELSSASPLFTFSPAMTAILAFLILKESLSYQQIIGFLFIIGGAYALKADHKLTNLLEPFKRMLKEKYFHYISITLILYAISSIIDRFILNQSNINHVSPITYMVIIHFFIMINYLILTSLFYEGFKDIKHGITKSGKWILIVSILMVASRLFLFTSLSIPAGKAALVVSIKRLDVLVAVLLGGEIFHEKKLLLKTIATIIMLIGGYLIII